MGAVPVLASANESATQPAHEDQPRLPTAPLGKTGVKITRLVMGASFPDYGPRVLRFAYQAGIRTFDNSHRYMNGKTEIILGETVGQLGKRDDLFLITKAKCFDPAKFHDWVVGALGRLKLDGVDLVMIHGLEDPAIASDRSGDWRRAKDRLLREKKARFMGFSCHLSDINRRVACVANAARSGWVDAIMLACDPTLIRANADLNKALEACAKAGVGLIAMKTGRGLGKAAPQPEQARDAFKALGLSPHHAMQAAIFSDGRFAAICTEMPNRKLVEENCANARAFSKPFTDEQWKQFDAAAKVLARATCPGCDGSCRRAAGTNTDFCSIARYLAYYDEDGRHAEARALLAALPPEQRDSTGADLDAASRACHARLDFRSILARVEEHLAGDPRL